MSSNLNCRLYEKTPGVWFYDLEQYSQRDEYDTFGPFPTFRAAKDNLSRLQTNPGGYSVKPLPGCKHDLLRAVDSPASRAYTHTCDRCGMAVDTRTKEDKQWAQMQYLAEHDPGLLLLAKLGEIGLTANQKTRLCAMGVGHDAINKVFKESAEQLKRELVM
jgi:hypothetical protein